MAEISFPPILTIKRNNFEKAFKIVMSKLISEEKLTIEYTRDINRDMVKWLITGMHNVDFEKNKQNQYVLDKLVNDLWDEFFRDLNMKVRKYRTQFRRK
jgi:hypothetical protein